MPLKQQFFVGLESFAIPETASRLHPKPRQDKIMRMANLAPNMDNYRLLRITRLSFAAATASASE
jgi:hypothetical protein